MENDKSRANSDLAETAAPKSRAPLKYANRKMRKCLLALYR